MSQEQLNQLIRDAFELHRYGDMSEIGCFIQDLSDKYNLKFNDVLFRNARNASYYFDRCIYFKNN